MKIVFWVLAIAFVIFAICSVITVVPPSGTTSHHMARIYSKIRSSGSAALAVENISKSESPEVLKDGWGKNIVIVESGTTSYTLISYGRDAVEGGEGEDSDIKLHFGLQDEGSVRFSGND